MRARAGLGAIVQQARIAQRREPLLDRARARPPAAAERPAAPHAQALVEEVADIVHERGSRARHAVLAGRMPAEHQQLLGTGHRRVQQIALRGQRILVGARAQLGQARERRQAPPLLLGQDRLRARGGREHAVLQPAHEQRPHAPGAHGERIDHRHRRRRGALAAHELDPLQQPRELRRAARRELRIQAGEIAQLAQRAPPGLQRTGLVQLAAAQDARPPAPGRAEQPFELARGPIDQRSPARG